MNILPRRGLLLALTLVLLSLQGCASDGSYNNTDDDPRNDPNQYWDRQPGFTPFSS